MRPHTHLPLAAGLAAVLTGASVVLAAPEAKALCIGGDTVCTTFDPSTDSNPTNVKPLGGFIIPGISAAASYTFTGVSFALAGSPASALSGFDNIKVIDGGPSGFGTLSLTPAAPMGNMLFAGAVIPPPAYSGATLLENLPGIGISFKIPSGLAIGSAITAQLSFQSGFDTPVLSNNVFLTTAQNPVPGPLPLLGAASAFGFSRSMRRRIKAAKAA